MKRMILGMVLTMLLLSGVYALETETSCFDATTLYEEISIKHYVDGVLDSTEIWNKTTPCDYGCVNNQCQPASLMSGGLFISLGFISTVLLIVGVMSKNKFFALIAAMIVLIIGIYITSEGLVVNGLLYEETVIRVIGIVLIMFSIFLFYSFIADVNETRKGNRGEFDE